MNLGSRIAIAALVAAATGTAVPAVAAGTPSPASPSATSAAATAPPAVPTLPPGSPLAPDGPGLQRFLDGTNDRFRDFALTPEPRRHGTTWTLYDVPNLTSTQDCDLVVPDDPKTPALLTCRVYEGDDLRLADEASASLVAKLASLTQANGAELVRPGKFLVKRETSFILASGARVVVSDDTRIDPHGRSLSFAISSAPFKP